MNKITTFTLLTCLGLFFSCKTPKTNSAEQTQNVPAMDQENMRTIEEGAGFAVYTKDHIPLSDAKVSINGTLIHFDTLYFQYRFPANVTEPYSLKIEHPIHGKLTVKNCYYDSKIVYLLEDSPYYYRQSGVQIPVSHVPNEYYLYMHNQHVSTVEEREQIDAEIAELLSSYPYELDYVTFDNKFDSYYFRKITLNPKGADLEAIYHLLNDDEQVAFFGPLLRHPNTQEHEAFGLSSTVEIYFNKALSAEQILEILREFDLESTHNLDPLQNGHTTASFKTTYGMDIMSELNRINEHPAIRRADNELFIISTH